MIALCVVTRREEIANNNFSIVFDCEGRGGEEARRKEASHWIMKRGTKGILLRFQQIAPKVAGIFFYYGKIDDNNIDND